MRAVHRVHAQAQAGLLGGGMSIGLTRISGPAVDAQNGESEAIRVTEVGFSEQHVALASTLEVLPSEFKRLDTISGQSASETVIHMTATDHSLDVYEVRAIGLFLQNGTLFAAYSHQASALFRKVDIANFLMAFDIVFSEAVGDDIAFGDTTFLYPPATEVTKGVAALATRAEVEAGDDDERIVTPLKLAQRLVAVLQAIGDEAQARAAGDNTEADVRTSADTALQAMINALRGITVTGGGLITGGGNLTANRALSVAAASFAEALAGTRNDVALTPASLGSFKSSFGQTDWFRMPGGLMLQWGRFSAGGNMTASVTFPLAFPIACLAVAAGGTSNLNVDSQDNPPAVLTSTISQTGFSVFASDNEVSGVSYIAVGY